MRLDFTVNVCFACRSFKQAAPIYQIPANYLPKPILKRKYRHSLSTSSPFTNSNVEFVAQYLFPKNKKSNASETLNIISKRDDYFQFQKISHIYFLKNEIDVDDFGNINYLNQDF